MASMTRSASGNARTFHVGDQSRTLRQPALLRHARASQKDPRRASAQVPPARRLRSCRLTLNPRSAHQAAMSPPMMPAPTTCTLRIAAASAAGLPPRDFRRSCSWNTRTRLREVLLPNSCAIDCASASYAARPRAPYSGPQIDDGVRAPGSAPAGHVRAPDRSSAGVMNGRTSWPRQQRARRSADDALAGRFASSLRQVASAWSAGTSASMSPMRRARSPRMVLASEHHVHGRAHAQQLHRAHRATESGMDAQLHLGQTQSQLAVVHAHAIAAGQRQFHAATQCKSVQQGRRRGRAAPRSGRTALVRAVMLASAVVDVGEGRELVDVRASNEAAGLARSDDQALGRGLFQSSPALSASSRRTLPRQRIGGLARNVEDQLRDAVRLALQ